MSKPRRLTYGAKVRSSKTHRPSMAIISDLATTMVAARECAQYKLPETGRALSEQIDVLCAELKGSLGWHEKQAADAAAEGDLKDKDAVIE